MKVLLAFLSVLVITVSVATAEEKDCTLEREMIKTLENRISDLLQQCMLLNLAKVRCSKYNY